jgi:hypothetical protein
MIRSSDDAVKIHQLLHPIVGAMFDLPSTDGFIYQ